MNLKNFYSFLLVLSISPMAKSALWAAQEESYHLKKVGATFAVGTMTLVSQRDGNSSQSNTQASTSISEFPNFNFSPDTEFHGLCKRIRIVFFINFIFAHTGTYGMQKLVS